MAKAGKQSKLKVFRTPIGFHDAYVAAPSMKAALVAWGADSNLFAQGIAEAVSDPQLMTAPLASPGKVIRVARGTVGDHLKAAGTSKAPRSVPSRSRTPKQSVRKPDRAALELAEDALRSVEQRHRAEVRALDREQQLLDRKRRDAARRNEAERDDAAAALERAKRSYERALREWKAGQTGSS